MWRTRAQKLRRRCWLLYEKKSIYVYISDGRVVHNTLIGDYVVERPLSFKRLKKFLKLGVL